MRSSMDGIMIEIIFDDVQDVYLIYEGAGGRVVTHSLRTPPTRVQLPNGRSQARLRLPSHCGR